MRVKIFRVDNNEQSLQGGLTGLEEDVNNWLMQHEYKYEVVSKNVLTTSCQSGQYGHRNEYLIVLWYEEQ